jgi:hypothetical protein
MLMDFLLGAAIRPQWTSARRRSSLALTGRARENRKRRADGGSAATTWEFFAKERHESDFDRLTEMSNAPAQNGRMSFCQAASRRHGQPARQFWLNPAVLGETRVIARSTLAIGQGVRPIMKRMLLVLAAMAVALPAAAQSPNLLRNPGFEDGASGWQLPPNVEVVKEVAHGDAHSLRILNTDAKTYVLASQNVAVQPGHRYRYGAWIRTRGVKGDDSGATICMEWSGPKGWMGGSYLDGRKGDRDWFHLEGLTGPIPDGATSVSVRLYLTSASRRNIDPRSMRRCSSRTIAACSPPVSVCRSAPGSATTWRVV